MFKRKTVIFVIILIAGLFAVSAVSAKDNSTADNYNARIIAEDMCDEYNPINGNDILFRIEGLDGNPIEDAKPKVTYDNKKIKAVYDENHYYSKNPGTYVLNNEPLVGNHKVKIELNTDAYSAKSVSFNVKITKIPTKLTLKKHVTTTGEYALMKATVKDKDNHKICEGNVKFIINGKSYTVKVKNGVATKKIKLNKAKTYAYKATFSSKNYKTLTKSSKLYIKQAKNYYTLKITNTKIHKTFKVNLPYKQYVKILNAKNNGKYAYASVDTGIKRPLEWGGGHYEVGLSTKDDYFTHYGYELGDYIFLRASSYLTIKKIDLYTANF